MESLVGSIDENISRTVKIIEAASEQRARFVVFPELSLTGYDLDQLTQNDRWFSLDDRRLDPVRDICSQLQITAVIGAPMKMESRSYLASLAISPDQNITVAPKTHLHGNEVDHFHEGTGPTIIPVDGWRVALAVCVDTAWPSHAMKAAESNADLYAASVLYTAGEERKLEVRLAARALDHRMYSLASNTAGNPLGQRSAGGSAIWAPDGRRLSHAIGADDELVVTSLMPTPRR